MIKVAYECNLIQKESYPKTTFRVGLKFDDSIVIGGKRHKGAVCLWTTPHANFHAQIRKSR